jgi:hypothetical protein
MSPRLSKWETTLLATANSLSPPAPRHRNHDIDRPPTARPTTKQLAPAPLSQLSNSTLS